MGKDYMSQSQFEQMMANHIAKQQYQQSIPEHHKPSIPAPPRMYSPEAMAHFSRPALVCEICGSPMTFNNPEWKDWERRWSVHRTCAEAIWEQLDRRSGITSERK